MPGIEFPPRPQSEEPAAPPAFEAPEEPSMPKIEFPPPADPGPPPWSPSLPPQPVEEGGAVESSPASGPAVDLNRATFVELREQGLSVSQATRVLAYRERLGGYRTPEDLAQVPGIGPEDLERLRGRFTT